MLYELSRVVLPTSEFLDYTNLFFNKSQRQLKFGENLKEYFVYKFNTWMNIFPVKKYHTYCNLNDLFLKINLGIDAQVMVFGFNYNEAIQNDELICKSDINANEETVISLDKFKDYENIYFCLVTETDNIKINELSWCTTTSPTRENKLVIVTCTFKREQYVYKNIKLFKNFIQENPELSEKIKMYIIDNGKTIDRSIEDNNVKIFQNKNAGGAGGFTRGIIEAKNSDENFTRILLMDDDVEVFPESFLRTLKIADYLKDEYRNSFIHGAMLNLYKKNMFFESTAIKTDDWCYSYHGEQDISQQKNIAATNYTPKEIFTDKEKKVSSAWWYCSFSMESVLNNGLPLPVFFRCDDLEWSWRNFGEHHITVNGISVWHSPFEWRVSKPVEYYFSKRNIIMINILHTENYKQKMLKMLKNDFKHLTKTYDYTSCEIYLRMMNDILQGGKIYKKDPEITLKEIFEYTKKDVIENSIVQVDSQIVKRKYLKSKIQKKYYKKYEYFIKKFIWLLSFQSKLIPTCLWKRKKVIWFSAPREEFLFCKKLYLLNLATNETEVRTYDDKKKNKLQKEFNKLYHSLDKKYDVLKNDFDNSYKEFITEDFWKNYLGL